MAKTIENLRTKENTQFVDWLVETAVPNTVNMLDNVECPCIKTLILERCSSEEVKAYIKISSMFAQVYQHIIENPCKTHLSKSLDDINRASLAFCLSTVEHSIVEMARRDKEFETE